MRLSSVPSDFNTMKILSV